jgi:prolycopene isomerase
MSSSNKSLKNKYDVIIIGAGIGGLTCASYLARAGFDVLICEQHKKPGGYVTSFNRKGFTFDAGPKSIGSNGVVFPILKGLGLFDRIRFIRPSIQMITPSTRLKIGSLAQIKEDLSASLPKARSQVNGYFNELEELINLFGEVFKPNTLSPFFDTDTPFRSMKLARTMLRYRETNSLDLINKHVSDERLRRILLLILTYPTMDVLTVAALWYSYLYDFWYPLGGMQVISNALADYFKSKGGTLRLNTYVSKILLKKGRASGVNLYPGEVVNSDFVISNADWRQTYTKLLDAKHVDDNFVRQIYSNPVSESFICVCLGTNLNKDQLSEMSDHNYYLPLHGRLCYERNHDDLDSFGNCDIYVSISLHDESRAPQNSLAITLMTMAQYNYFSKRAVSLHSRGKGYRNLKASVAKQLIKIAEGIIPNLSKNIVTENIATPLTYERYTLNSEGASAGWNWNPRYSFRTDYSSVFGSLKTPITNLLTCGHWCLIPGSVPSSMITGKKVAELVEAAY